MQIWNVLHAKKCHLGTIAQLCRAISSQLRHLSTIWKKHVKQQYLPHMSLQYGPTSGWDRFGSLGHPSYFQRLPHLGSITARHVVVGVSQTVRRWTQGATYVRQGDHHVGHWPTFLAVSCFTDCDSWKMKHTSIQHIVMTFYVNVTCKSFCELFVGWQCSLPVLDYIIVDQVVQKSRNVLLTECDDWVS